MPRIPRRKHTNLTNEITGEYYEETTYKLRWPSYVLLVIVAIALYDLFIGINTEWLEDLLVMFVNK